MSASKSLKERIHEKSTLNGYGDPDALRGHLWELEELKHREKMQNDKKALYIAILSLAVAIASLLVSLFR
jgi:hypothetical protein